jgi:hypothetical protein
LEWPSGKGLRASTIEVTERPGSDASQRVRLVRSGRAKARPVRRARRVGET